MPLRNNIKKVLVIGSGPIVIGQAAEFDYAGTQACLALKEEGIEVVLVNSNPATIMTDQSIADRVYIEPLTVDAIETIIAIERPDGVIGTLGGQTGLNLIVRLSHSNILNKYGVELLGTSVESIENGEDRDKFRSLMMDIKEPVPQSKIVNSLEEGFAFVSEIGYPVIIRPAYTLGGAGGGFAHDNSELESVLKKGLSMSPIGQVLLEKSIKGWKEIEYEVMRDANDTCIIVCNMENMDPVGVHTGDSIVVAPSQTLTDVQHQMLRNSSLKVIRALEIIGGCNIQFALDPHSNAYHIIEVNPRVSRSSALASKATGYPIARIAAKCAVGYHLDELLNPITGTTYASFEPALDYIVVKLPRFPFDKFTEADRSLSTQMKATGEVMAIDRTFEGALNKSLRSLELKVSGLNMHGLKECSSEKLMHYLQQATDVRIFAIAEAFRRGMETESIHSLTEIDRWFLEKVKTIVLLEEKLEKYTWETVPKSLLKEAKFKNTSDAYLSTIYAISEQQIRQRWKGFGWKPSYKLVDTCAAEFDAVTPYYYSTWSGEDEVEVSNDKKVLVIGSGPIRIGQGIEFDYCSVHATLALKNKGYEAIVINNNPETVSTDYAIADRLYFEPLSVEDIINVAHKEQVEGVLIQFGGQTAINVAKALEDEGIKIFGTSTASIDRLEDRQQFYDVLSDLEIPHIEGKTVNHPNQLQETVRQLGYPVLVRPSYVIGGQSMYIFYCQEELTDFIIQINWDEDSRLWPLLVDRYIPGLECEMDVISDGEEIIVPGIVEHIERAGVHSGDSVTVFPTVSLSNETKSLLVEYARRIAKKLSVAGMMNIQYVIADERVYIIDVNPRSSRTVPVMSKVTGIPMIEWATYVQLGMKLSELHPTLGLLQQPEFYSVKAPVFSSGKLTGVDYVLGPEMKSTGEVLGLGRTLAEAMEKALFFGEANPFHFNDKRSYVFCSIADRDKSESLQPIHELTNRGFTIIATKGTAHYLMAHGITVTMIGERKEQIEPLFKNNEIALVINTPTQGRVSTKQGFQLREMATRYQVPCYTHVDTIKAALALPKVIKQKMSSINEYHQLKWEVV